MLRDGDGEKEILLGNKQLLGIFFLVVILLGVAFAGGYKLGQGSHKTPVVAEEGAPASATNTGAAETHAVTPESAAANTAGAATDTSPSSTTESPAEPTDTAEPPLGARTKPAKQKPIAPAIPADTEAPGPEPAPVALHTGFTPQAGQTFLQVAAVQRDEAEAISDVLRKKGFHAHAVPKPASKLYRVIIGPVHDASDLNSTRAALRNTGFREIFVQRY